jgi:hypothetical protein
MAWIQDRCVEPSLVTVIVMLPSDLNRDPKRLSEYFIYALAATD